VRARVLLIALSAALIGFAPAPFPRAERQRGEDQSDVAGTWEFEPWEREGKREVQDEKEYRLELTRDQFVLVSRLRKHRERRPMRLDPLASPPSFALGERDATYVVGSYRLHKGRLTVIFNIDSDVQRRPRDFAGRSTQHVVLRRVGG
jgi:uncharacterized protein (TIGR03067 family)